MLFKPVTILTLNSVSKTISSVSEKVEVVKALLYFKGKVSQKQVLKWNERSKAWVECLEIKLWFLFWRSLDLVFLTFETSNCILYSLWNDIYIKNEVFGRGYLLDVLFYFLGFHVLEIISMHSNVISWIHQQ